MTELSAWQQVAEYLRARIRSGELKPGEKVLSVIKLAEACGVSHITSQRALEELVDAGTLRVVPGVGHFVEEDPHRADQLRELRDLRGEVRDLRSRVHRLERAKERVRDALAED